jgi:ankyrin repeat protein
METNFTERQRKTWKRPTLTVHMAASIPKYPTFALQLPLLLNHKSVRQFDENHKIPLHYAVMCASEDHYHCKSNLHDLYWGSGIDEHRSIVQYLIEYAPDTTLMRDGDGRLPLHLAVINGTFEGSIQSLLNLNPSQVKDIDPVSGLYPYMLAASEGRNVNIIFNLLLMCPTLAYTSESVHTTKYDLSRGIQPKICDKTNY